MAGIQINLAGNFTKLDELKDKAAKTAASIKSAFGSNIGKAMFGGIAAAGAAAFASVTVAMKSAIDAGGELSDVMARTGADGAKLFVMQRAFENAGIAADQVPQALNKMQKALAGVNEEGEPTSQAFAKLGLSIGQLLQLDPVDAFRATSEAIGQIQDPAQRAAAAMEIFGKSGAALLVVMTDTKAFSGAAEQVGGLAQTLSDNANAFDVVSDSLGLMDVKMQQLGAEVAVSLLPQLTAFSEWVNATDLSDVGARIGAMTENTLRLADAFHQLIKLDPFYQAGKFVEGAMNDFGNLNDADRAAARKEAAGMADPNYKKGDGVSQTEEATEKQAAANAGQLAAESASEAVAAKRTAEETAKKAAADQKSAEEKAKSRAAAMEEYNVESAMLSARLKGDAQKLASLEREKKIREEMKRLESAGFTAEEARKPAEAKVDAEKKASAGEEARQKAEDERRKIQDTLQGKLESARGRVDDQQFQSSLGAVSAMQRVGGGGGAVSSGLDYARQSADLQREANGYLRQLIEAARPEPGV
jgi:hypothetical protein